ncbi:hypothetical protein TRIUR3_32491 [Triticum urartu]|uniref:Uncharacterized protein n=1 Tax=Triticum urartu TaxID=4572 RepID=M8AQ55_TRIUA|nr:hypothetical protein TRIUR3_32491 [Triticum urartu]
MARSMNPLHTTIVLSVVLLLVFLANHGQSRNLDPDMGNGSKVILLGDLCRAGSCADMPGCYCCMSDDICRPSLVACSKTCGRSSSTRVLRRPPV